MKGDNTTTFQDIDLNVDLKLISMDRDTGDTQYLDLDLASVNYFEINDNLIDFGLNGNITFPNWGQLLEKLTFNSLNSKKAEQFLAVSLQDVNITRENNEEEDLGYHFLASAKSGSSLMQNTIDIKQTLDFEEVFTSSLKKISYDQIIKTNPSKGNPNTSYDLTLLINVLVGLPELDLKLVKSKGLENYKYQLKGRVVDFKSAGNDSLYSIIQNIYNHLTLETTPKHVQRVTKNKFDTVLALLKTKSAPTTVTDPLTNEVYESDSYERSLELRELISDEHVEFIETYAKEITSDKDFSNVYLEEFAIAPIESTSSNTALQNKVEKYDLIKPDINNLRQTIWGDYKGEVGDVNTTGTSDDILYSDLVDRFEKNILNGLKSNLPFIPNNETKLFKLAQFSQGVAGNDYDSEQLLKSRIYNTVLRSFMFLNETIVLEVHGRLDRRPGKFISIKSELCPSRAEELWFVIDVKHQFIGGSYQNKITAVRFLGNQDQPN